MYNLKTFCWRVITQSVTHDRVNMQLTYFWGTPYFQRVKNHYISLLGLITKRKKMGSKTPKSPYIIKLSGIQFVEQGSKRGYRNRVRTMMQNTDISWGGGGPIQPQTFQTLVKKMLTASYTCQSGTTLFSCTPLPLRSCDLGAGIGWLKPWLISSRPSRGIMGNVVYSSRASSLLSPPEECTQSWALRRHLGNGDIFVIFLFVIIFNIKSIVDREKEVETLRDGRILITEQSNRLTDCHGASSSQFIVSP